jgi:hypothetical protein
LIESLNTEGSREAEECYLSVNKKKGPKVPRILTEHYVDTNRSSRKPRLQILEDELLRALK